MFATLRSSGERRNRSFFTVFAGSSSKRAVLSSSDISSIISETSLSEKWASISSISVLSINSNTSMARSFAKSLKRKTRSTGGFSPIISAMSAGSIVLSSSFKLLNFLAWKSLSMLSRNLWCKSFIGISPLCYSFFKG